MDAPTLSTNTDCGSNPRGGANVSGGADAAGAEFARAESLLVEGERHHQASERLRFICDARRACFRAFALMAGRGEISAAAIAARRAWLQRAVAAEFATHALALHQERPKLLAMFDRIERGSGDDEERKRLAAELLAITDGYERMFRDIASRFVSLGGSLDETNFVAGLKGYDSQRAAVRTALDAGRARRSA